MLSEGRQTLKHNYTSEFMSSPSDSGQPKEHAHTGTARLKKKKEDLEKSVHVMPRSRAKNANSDLLLPSCWRGSCYYCSASTRD